MKAYLEKIKELLDMIQITDISCKSYNYNTGLNEIVGMIYECKKNKRMLYICGNGGSAGIAQHMTADYFKNGGLRTYNMFGGATITCLSNDLAYEDVFSKQLELLVNKDDLLIAISSSGESNNIVKAIETMRNYKGRIITLTGFDIHNREKKMGDYNIYIPIKHYGMVESIHNLILQQIVDIIIEIDDIAIQR